MDEKRISCRLTGIAVSPGVAIGRAQCLHSIPIAPKQEPVDEASVLDELAAFEEATKETAVELEALHEKVTQQIGTDEAAIFRAHESILRDPALAQKVRQFISERRLTAAAAIEAVADDYRRFFDRVEDEYLKDRFADLRDVLERIADKLAKTDRRIDLTSWGPVVLVADELLPSDIIAVSENEVLAIVTQSGGRTSHAAILARSYGLPAVGGVAGLLERVHSGDPIIVDGSAGCVFIDPGTETLKVYRKARRDYASVMESLDTGISGPARTADGTDVQLLANINCQADLAKARSAGAAGVGLYRTEFFFLTHPSIPSEEDQTAEYRAIVSECPGQLASIRTLDLGGDKTIPYLTHTHESNPFMGWRSIRLSFEHIDLFLEQIRAVMRAAHGTDKEVRLLFPMITTWDDLQQVKNIVQHAIHQLRRGRVPCGSVRVGIMIEVPAAAVMIDHLIDQVDYVCVGTNDLVQYMTAADRDNPKVSHLCQSLSPAVLRVLSSVIRCCFEADKPVTVCGEMAGSPRAFPLLLAMGLRSFSMSPAFIPVIRDLAGRLSCTDAGEMLKEVLQLRSSSEIHHVMDSHIQ